MQTRQSTMLKPLKVLAIFLALIVLVNGQDDSTNDSTNDSSLESSNESTNSDESTTAVDTSDSDSSSDSNSSILDGGLLGGILDSLQQSPLGIIFLPLGLILRPIFSFVDLILSPVFLLVRTILWPVVTFLNLVTLPVHGVAGLLGGVTSFVSGLLSMVSIIVSLLLSNVSGILSFVLGQVSLQTGLQRRRRGITDSMTGMAWTLSLPFRFATDIISAIISLIYSPFNLSFKTVGWLYHLVFGGGTGNEFELSTDLSPINDMMSSLVLNLSDSSQDALIELGVRSWAVFKEYVLPYVDKFVVTASTSSLVPDDVKSWLASIHTGYMLLNTFGFL